MNIEKRIKIRNLDVLIPSRKKFRLRWKEYQILSLLVSRSPELVSRSEIIENIWKGTYCSDSTINQTIKSIRQKIGDDGHTMIRTIPRLGYKVENKEIFQFISEEDAYVLDDLLSSEDDSEIDIQSESSVIIDKDDDEMNAIATSENRELHDTLVPGQSDLSEKKFITSKPPSKNGFSPVLLSRGMKYLVVFISLLVISHLSYVLGYQTHQPMVNDIQKKPQLVLSLTLNGSRSSSPQALICLYHEGTDMEVRIECIDPKLTPFQEQTRYELSAMHDNNSKARLALASQTK